MMVSKLTKKHFIFLLTSIFYIGLAGCSPSTGKTEKTAEDIGDYIIYSDGTVFDKKADLTWMACTLGQTWKNGDCTGDADLHILNSANELKINFGDKQNWRLPTIDELHSIVYCRSERQRPRELDSYGSTVTQTGNQYFSVIVNHNGGCSGKDQEPTIYRAAFPSPLTEYNYLSSSTHLNDNSMVWTVDFINGGVEIDGAGHPNYVRLVRDGK